MSTGCICSQALLLDRIISMHLYQSSFTLSYCLYFAIIFEIVWLLPIDILLSYRIIRPRVDLIYNLIAYLYTLLFQFMKFHTSRFHLLNYLNSYQVLPFSHHRHYQVFGSIFSLMDFFKASHSGLLVGYVSSNC